MAFDGDLMADPVVAFDGITYERRAIELRMKKPRRVAHRQQAVRQQIPFNKHNHSQSDCGMVRAERRASAYASEARG